MAVDYAARMRWMQNEDLFEIVSADSDKYLPDAIDAAKAELASRSLSSEAMDELRSDQQRRVEEVAEVPYRTLS